MDHPLHPTIHHHRPVGTVIGVIETVKETETERDDTETMTVAETTIDDEMGNMMRHATA